MNMILEIKPTNYLFDILYIKRILKLQIEYNLLSSFIKEVIIQVILPKSLMPTKTSIPLLCYR